MPWQISTVHPPSLTFHDFWTKELVPRCPARTLSQVYVGKAKESMDLALVRQASNALGEKACVPSYADNWQLYGRSTLR